MNQNPAWSLLDGIRVRGSQRPIWDGVELGQGVSTRLETRFGEGEVWGFDRLSSGVPLIGAEVVAVDYRSGRVGTTLARVHDSCASSERLASVHCDCADQLEVAHELIAAAGGVLVVDQGHEGRGIGFVEKVKAYGLQWNEGLDTYAADARLGVFDDLRRYDHVASALRQMGVGPIRLLSGNRQKAARLRAAGVQIVAVESFAVSPRSARAARYLDAKLTRCLEAS